MRVLLAALVAIAVASIVAARRSRDLEADIGRYLRSTAPPAELRSSRPPWDATRVVWPVVGAFIGVLLAQGDLFLAGPSRPVGALAVVGALGGWLGWSARRSTERERRARRLRYELPVICDALALQVVSGESVASAVSHVVRTTTGVARDELEVAMGGADEIGVEAALLGATAQSAHPDARRLYELLAYAHVSGGRLADALVDLAADYRAGLERDLTTESGRRAVTTYGPVLALMVPTALLFLLYPTLVGLRSLAGAP